MAYLNEKEGSIVSHCPGCRGGRSTFEWKDNNGQFGAHERREEDRHWSDCVVSYRLFKCAGCGMGAFGVIKMGGAVVNIPVHIIDLLNFFQNQNKGCLFPTLYQKE
ncbi:MAG: hypothetical protein GY797_15725 [Deltaproteobacteria bacterium]|nr:hypothetical protein [Deltaproteobacteria bacterium]